MYAGRTDVSVRFVVVRFIRKHAPYVQFRRRRRPVMIVLWKRSQLVTVRSRNENDGDKNK